MQPQPDPWAWVRAAIERVVSTNAAAHAAMTSRERQQRYRRKAEELSALLMLIPAPYLTVRPQPKGNGSPLMITLAIPGLIRAFHLPSIGALSPTARAIVNERISAESESA